METSKQKTDSQNESKVTVANPPKLIPHNTDSVDAAKNAAVKSQNFVNAIAAEIGEPHSHKESNGSEETNLPDSINRSGSYLRQSFDVFTRHLVLLLEGRSTPNEEVMEEIVSVASDQLTHTTNPNTDRDVMPSSNAIVDLSDANDDIVDDDESNEMWESIDSDPEWLGDEDHSGDYDDEFEDDSYGYDIGEPDIYSDDEDRESIESFELNESVS